MARPPITSRVLHSDETWRLCTSCDQPTETRVRLEGEVEWLRDVMAEILNETVDAATLALRVYWSRVYGSAGKTTVQNRPMPSGIRRLELLLCQSCGDRLGLQPSKYPVPIYRDAPD